MDKVGKASSQKILIVTIQVTTLAGGLGLHNFGAMLKRLGPSPMFQPNVPANEMIKTVPDVSPAIYLQNVILMARLENIAPITTQYCMILYRLPLTWDLTSLRNDVPG